MSLINYLGTFDTLTAAWEAYPEGGKEGDYIIIGEEYYKWDKYSSLWSLSAYIPKEAKAAEEDYFTPMRNGSDVIGDTSEQTNVFINFLGHFASLTEVWEVYPEGGKEGDYIIISEQRLWWNKYAQAWDNAIIASSDIIDVEIDITLPSSCVNPLGRFDSLADAWRKHPEGGREGDYIQIAEDIYKWDKYLTAWINIKELPSSELMPIVPTFTEDVVEYSDGYINYIGTFDTLEQVWLVYPEGGKEGDYIIVDGERYRWNKLTNNWGEVDPDAETPARPVVSIFGDLHIHNDTVIGEKLYAEILNTFTTKRWIIEQGYLGVKDITPTLIMSNIVPDNVTIGIKDGKLVVIGGGTADSISWEDITNKPSWLEGEEGFVTISSEQTIRAHKNFEKGISVQGAPISYDAVKKVWIFDANMLVTGGLAWNSSLDGFKPETITDAVIVDGITLGRTPEGALCVIGDIGGLDEEALQEYLDFNKYVTTNYVKDNYIAINGDQNVDGIKNFANGLKIGNALITYNAEKNVFILSANLLVEKGIAWNSSIEGFEPKTITDAVMIDDSTLGRNENGEIYVKGGAGGGGSIKYPLSWSGYSSGVYDGSASANIAIPSLMSQMHNDVEFITTASVNSLLTDYLPKSGGTISGELIIKAGATNSAVIRFRPDEGAINHWLGVNKNGALWYSNDGWSQQFDILHSGNVADYALPKDGTAVAANRLIEEVVTDLNNATAGRIFTMTSGYGSTDGNKPTTGWVTGLTLQFAQNGAYRRQLAYSDDFFVRDETNGAWGDWRKILTSTNFYDYALPITGGTVNGNITATKFIGALQGNADSATKLASSRKIWGQYFNGTGDVNGLFKAYGEYGGYSMYAGSRENEALSIEIITSSGGWLGRGIMLALNGNVAIGGATADEKLHVHGNLLATGEITQHSSLVLKDVVDTRFLTLKELVALKPYNFRWKDGRDDKLHAGAVADYVKPILPEVISTDKDNIHSMNYANAAWIVGTSLTPYVSKHEEDIDWLKARVRYLEDKLKEC